MLSRQTHIFSVASSLPHNILRLITEQDVQVTHYCYFSHDEVLYRILHCIGAHLTKRSFKSYAVVQLSSSYCLCRLSTTVCGGPEVSFGMLLK